MVIEIDVGGREKHKKSPRTPGKEGNLESKVSYPRGPSMILDLYILENWHLH